MSVPLKPDQFKNPVPSGDVSCYNHEDKSACRVSEPRHADCFIDLHEPSEARFPTRSDSSARGSHRFFVVRDPQNQRTLRFTFEGYQVARLLDGSRSLPQLVKEIRRSLGLQLTVEKLRRLIARLDALGCLTRTQGPSTRTLDRAVTRVIVKSPRATTNSALLTSSGIRAANDIAAREVGDDFELEPVTPRSYAEASSRAVVAAGFALVSAALWASWAVLQII